MTATNKRTAAAAGADHDDSQPESKVLKAAEGGMRKGEQPTQVAVEVLALRHAVSGDKGTRPTMEDVHVAVAADAASHDNSQRVWHFSLLDGHGGVACAALASQLLHEAVLAAGLVTQKAPAAAASSSDSQEQAGGSRPWTLDVRAAKQAIVQGFADTDARVLARCRQGNWTDGATCVAVWLVGATALVAGIGDAKCVLARLPAAPQPGASKDALLRGLKGLVLTKDHLAMHAAERARIEKAGGHVTADGRLNGRIQVSRSFGDVQFKGAGSSATPDVTAFSVTARERFLLCACDGFWSVVDPQDAVELAAEQLRAGRDAKQTCNRLLNEAVTVRRCKDNCSVLLVLLHAEDAA